ncbi:organic cation transporter protein-like [Antedon mediterranea]|uniref:organic cation transporter protein-like n=1 Tax=Antedon mediterranea TaxID=105859 RepID=UPI003AF50D7A
MKFDDVFKYIGEYGLYHKILTNIVLCVVISNTLSNIGTVFLNGKMDHYCKVPNILENTSCSGTEYECGLDNLMLPPDDESTAFINETKCRMYTNLAGSNETQITKCKYGWTYDQSQYESTIVSEFDLVCEDSYKVSLAASSFLFGYFFGSIIFGAICDYFGRKRGIILAILLRILTGVAMSLAPSYWFYFVCRVANGCLNIGLFISVFVYVNEFVAPSKRAFISAMANVYFCVGFLILAFLAYFIRAWRTLYLVVSICPGLLLLVYFFIPESPRWLLLQNRQEEAKNILQKIAKFSNKELPDDFIEHIELKTEPTKQRPSTFASTLNIFRYSNMRRKTLILIYCWFTACLVYYGLTYGVEGLDVNVYVGICVMGVLEFFATFTTAFSIQRFGRRSMLVACLIITGTMSFINIWIPSSYAGIRTAISLTGRFFVTGTFIIAYVITAEIFSTDVRTIGLGICSFMARFAGVLAPQILFLEKLWKPLPLVAFSFTSMSAGLLVLLLPETLNYPLPQTIEEAELVTRDTNRNWRTGDDFKMKSDKPGSDKGLEKKERPDRKEETLNSTV